jgi:hypothetical protein
MAEARAESPRSARPFAGGVAVRAEGVTCEACIAVGADEQESFLIHHMDADGRPLAAAADVPVAVDDTERSGYASGWEIVRGGGYVVGVQ